MPRRLPPTRTLAERPHLDQLKRQAQELLSAYLDGGAAAVEEVTAYYRRPNPATFALHDAQLVLARAYGFDSWPKLKAFVDGATVRLLVEAVRAGDLARVRAIVDARPEIVHVDVGENDEHRALHHAVLQRQPEIVRFLMQQGADARKGIWPHRGATTAHTLAVERGYDEIARIIEDEEAQRRSVPNDAVARAGHVEGGTAGAGQAADGQRTSELREAIASGDADYLRARFADGHVTDGAGLVSHAIAVDRPDMVGLLLDLGLDPDESTRVDGLDEYVATWGGPLRTCAIAGRLAAAEILLAHGANPNTNVYAASGAMYEAVKRGDRAMVALLEKHGGRLSPVAAAELGLVAESRTLLEEAAQDASSGKKAAVAQELLWGAVGSSSPEIVALALEAIDWPRDDPQWHGILENALYVGPSTDRRRHFEALQRVLDRCDPDITSRRGTTLLHEIAASRGGLTAEDRTALTTILLDRGAGLDVRDAVLESTPLGWACRWGRIEMAALLIERGADPVERDAPHWATPRAWANKRGHREIGALLGGVPTA